VCFFWLLVRFFAYCRLWSQNLLQSEGFSDDAALDQAIKKLEAGLKKARKKAANDGDEVTVKHLFSDPVSCIDCPSLQEEPSFPLADTPDDQVCSPESHVI
jgi:actin-related protein 5